MKQIVIVGEAWGEHEERQGRPFVGPSGSLLNAFLSAHGLARQECYLTNVFNFRPVGKNLDSLMGSKHEGITGKGPIESGKYIRAEFAGELVRLYKEIRDINPNVVVALGNTACWALANLQRPPSIKKMRGGAFVGVTGHKVFATYHPAAILRDMTLRPIVFSDFAKVRAEAEYPEIRRPSREFWLEPNLEDLARFEHDYILPAERLSVDIETTHRQIEMIGFAPSIDRAIVIPFIDWSRPGNNYWPTFEEEAEAWRFVIRWMSLGIPLLGQNFIYDLTYMWADYGITIGEPRAGAKFPPVSDTMLLAHAMQPEMEKGLEFLASLHTSEPRWKFLRAHEGTLKKED